MKATLIDSTAPLSLHFLSSESHCSSLIRSKDWTQTSLGHINEWPQSLQTMIGVMLENKFPMYIAWGKDFTQIYNDSFASILGSRHPIALGATPCTTFPETWDLLKPCFEKIMSGGSVENFETYFPIIKTQSENNLYIDTSYSPIKIKPGEVGGILITVAQSIFPPTCLSKVETLLSHAPLGIVTLEGPEHLFTSVNDTSLAMMNRKDRSFLGKRIIDVLPEVEEQGFIKLLDRVYKTGEPYTGKEVPLVIKQIDGSEKKIFVNFVYQALRDQIGKVTGISSMAYDVTELVQAREKIKESELRYKFLTDVLPQLMWTSLPDGSVNYANKRCLEYSGLSDQEKYGSGWISTIHPDDLPLVGKLWSESMAAGITFQAEYRIKRFDGVYRWFLGRAVPIRNDEGKIDYWTGTATDIEEQKEALQKLERETKLREQFVATLTHDLRNPLTSVKLNAQILKKCSPEPEQVVSISGRIIKALDRLNQMIENLLDASKIKSGEPLRLELQEISLNSLLIDTVNELSSTQDQKYITNTPDKIITGLWNKDAIRRMIENLCTNAHKYGTENYPVTVTLSAAETTAYISVHNWGPTISTLELNELFLPFKQIDQRQSSKKGWGLGLTLVKGFAEAMGGSINVQSSSESGTIFTISLPIREL